MDCPMFKIAVDSHNIFTVDGFHSVRLPNSDVLQADRMNIEGFVLPTNSLWYVIL